MSVLLDISSYEAVFEVNYRSFCTASYRIVQDKDIAEEIVKDVFYKLWEKKKTLTIETSLKAYLLKKVIESSVNFQKSICTAGSRVDLVNTSEDPIGPKNFSTTFVSDHIIEGLPETCRTVFILNRYEALNYSQIAAHLNISNQKVEQEMLNALKYLIRY
jgi:RNA polymerase sigma-70 factor (ECF subfamily)